ncbi:hypothetical protein BOW53_05290 [Solemya pervernicosa gill symbiont]|uniref:Peptidase C39 domain-containing protein n=2 Tax=Gammaproteobacteria incertae sedis TaxID=118884 RepID=A0A1T2L763_9GAMM|nr:hypothetical protein BOW53_05290 [Solemya pervernicosa gill symbiont]
MSGCINMPIKESGERAFQREFAGMTYIKVPYVEQESAVTCGVAVIQSVSDFWGSPIDQQTMLVDHPPADTEEGYSLAELKTIVKRHSRLKAFVLKANGKLLEQMIAKGRPVIVAVRTEPRPYIETPFEFTRRLVRILAEEYNHYIAVIGINKEKVAIMDPAQGFYVMKRDRFNTIWAELGNASLLIAK